MAKSMIVSAWSNYSRFEIGAEWNFIKGYWDISFTFLFWSISFSKNVDLPVNDFEIVVTEKSKK